MSDSRLIRSLSSGEVETLIDWAAGEGWNPGFADAAAFEAADREGFIGAFVAGEMVSGIAGVAYGDGYGFIGLYICRPDRRGQGHGKAVWDRGMAHLGDRTIGLDAVPAQQENYGRMGFVPAYRTVRHSGVLPAIERGGDVRAVTPALMPAILDLDRRFFPASRPAFLGRWLGEPHVAMAAMREGAVAGYGVARRCREGWKIGPLFAEGEAETQNLLAALGAAIGGEQTHLDVPESAEWLTEFLRRAGFTPGFTTTRMYKGPVPGDPGRGIQAITSLELG